MLDIMTCFGGGVLFGTYLITMTPEVRMLLEHGVSHDIDYPLPEVLTGLGFFMMLFVEKLVHHLSSHEEKSEGSASICKTDSQTVETVSGCLEKNGIYIYLLYFILIE